jgi:hypothetical protein
MRKIVDRNPLSALENGSEIGEIIAASRFATYLPAGTQA